MTTLETGEKLLWDIRIVEFIDVVSKDTSKPTELIAALITKYFPEKEIDIFTQIPERSQSILKRNEVEKELGQIMIEELKQNLVGYRDAPSNKQSNYLTNLIKQCDTFYKNLTNENKDNVNLVTIAITYSIMHLAILKEKSTYHKEIFNSYESDLRQKVEGYKKYFLEIYYKWENWRKNCIEVKMNNNIPNKVYDTFNGKSVTYINTEINQAAITRYTEMCKRVKVRYFDEANAEFMKMYLYTFTLDKFLPNNSNARTIAPNRKIGTIVYGIYGQDTFPDGDHGPEDHSELHQMSNDKPDVITGINVHAGFFLDCLKVKYKNQIGTSIGNEKGGEVTTIRHLDEKYNYVTGVKVYFRERVVSGIQFLMSDGQETMMFGNGEANQKSLEIKCGPIGYNNDFRLVGIQMAESKADKHFNRCVGHISLTFEHVRIAN
ncbi:161_t:CDS:2 [Cetraspora pellucida]|uniref:161_t:CDS:1 n=1 Tax=Cetraspora pellucida TaxID=1433469 RepID=A0A9N9G2H9_9GLOM|nr:161_t:CDS:2 [Cetraspora pellucida]